MAAQALEAEVIKSVNGNAVVVDDSPRHRGRPRKLTVKRFLAICALVQKGVTNTQACLAEDINYSGFRTHVRRKRWWAKRFQIADQIRDEYMRDYHLAQITKHAKEGNWLCSAWVLERRFPHLFALHYTEHRTAESVEESVGTELPAEVLARHRALMLELAREDEAKQAKAVELPDAELNTKQTT